MDKDSAIKLTNEEWESSIVPELIEYIKIPNNKFDRKSANTKGVYKFEVWLANILLILPQSFLEVGRKDWQFVQKS